MNIFTLRAKQFDLACHHVEIEEYDGNRHSVIT